MATYIKNLKMALEMTQEHWKEIVRYIRRTPAKKLKRTFSGTFVTDVIHTIGWSKEDVFDIKQHCYFCEYVKLKCTRCPVNRAMGRNCYSRAPSIWNDFCDATTKKDLLAAAIAIRDFDISIEGFEP